MIRLVAADMDGTLLTDSKQLYPETLSVIKELRRQGILFVIASGRQYYNLCAYFEEIQKDLLFICENGALIYENGKPLYVNEMPPEALVGLLDATRMISCAHIVACGLHAAYTESTDESFLTLARRYFERLTVVPRLQGIWNADCFVQLSVYHPDAETQVLPCLLAVDAPLDIHASERCWIDIHQRNTNKGTAMRFIQERHALTPSECMAFGDYLNDTELVRCCMHSFAMENSHPALAQLCPYRCGSNNSGGVITALQEWFSLK